MEEVVLADEEDARKLLKVISHHDVLRWALAEAEQGVNVFDASKSLLPKLELDRHVQLLKARVEVALQCVWIAEVDGVHLLRKFCRVLEVIS